MSMGSGVGIGFKILAPLLTSCVTLQRLFNFSESQFSHLSLIFMGQEAGFSPFVKKYLLQEIVLRNKIRMSVLVISITSIEDCTEAYDQGNQARKGN